MTPSPTGVGEPGAWQRHYTDPDVVADYREDSHLQPAESVILGLLAADLPTARLLDVGVGAGRTATHLAGRVAEYQAVDFAAGMVDACRERFAAEPWCRAHTFAQADARALPQPDGGFDIVLFSFNGMDYVPAADRARVLAECRRVLRRGGRFVYSSHNLDWLDGRGPRSARRGLRARFSEWMYRRHMLRMNAALLPLNGTPTAELAEPPDGLTVYYARLAEHLHQARAARFESIRVFDRSGATVDPACQGHRDAWLYFLSTAASVLATLGGLVELVPAFEIVFMHRALEVDAPA